MFRLALGQCPAQPRFPRIRGDVPLGGLFINVAVEFSPHTRGCSEREDEYKLTIEVFPAYAGMFRSNPATGAKQLRFPRIRGDVPG